MNKSGKVDLVLILIIVGIGFFAIKSGVLGSLFGAAPTAPDTKVTIDGACGVDDTTLTVGMYNAITKSTALTGLHTRIFIGDNSATAADKGYVIHGGTLTVSPTDKLIIYYGENSTTYYTSKQAVASVPCKGTFDATGHLYAMDTAVTFTFWNENSAANTKQTVAADSTYTLPIRLQATSKKAFGNPELGIANQICFKGNTSMYTNFELNGADGAPKASSPVSNAISSGISEAGYTVKCFEFPVIKDTGKFEGNLVVTTASVTPITNISVAWNDVDYDLNADNNAEIIGFQDEDNNDLGTTYQTGTIITYIG